MKTLENITKALIAPIIGASMIITTPVNGQNYDNTQIQETINFRQDLIYKNLKMIQEIYKNPIDNISDIIEKSKSIISEKNIIYDTKVFSGVDPVTLKFKQSFLYDRWLLNCIYDELLKDFRELIKQKNSSNKNIEEFIKTIEIGIDDYLVIRSLDQNYVLSAISYYTKLPYEEFDLNQDKHTRILLLKNEHISEESPFDIRRYNLIKGFGIKEFENEGRKIINQYGF